MKKTPVIIAVFIIFILVANTCSKKNPSAPAPTPNATQTAAAIGTIVAQQQTAGASGYTVTATFTLTPTLNATQTAAAILTLVAQQQTAGASGYTVTSTYTPTLTPNATQTAAAIATIVAQQQTIAARTPTITPTLTVTPGPPACPTKTPVPSSYGLLIDNCDQGENKNALGGSWYTFNDCSNGGNSQVWPISYPMGGSFKMDYPGIGNCGYAVHMTGTVNGASQGGYQYGYIGLGTDSNANASSQCMGADWSAYTGIQFWTKAGPADSGYGYKVVIPYTADGASNTLAAGAGNTCTDSQYAVSCITLDNYSDNQYVFTPPTTWTQLTIPFSAFAGPGWGTTPAIATVLKDVKSLQWHTYNETSYPYNVDLWVDEILLYY